MARGKERSGETEGGGGRGEKEEGKGWIQVRGDKGRRRRIGRDEI